MCSHYEWADAEHWKAFAALPEALKDETLFKTLYHIHFVQSAFLYVLRGERPVLKRAEDFTEPEMLRSFAADTHKSLKELLSGISPDDFETEVRIPWAKKEFMPATKEKAFMQAFMHSHYHRAQNARRFRELGGAPPTTDYIMWCWLGEPAAAW